MNIEKTKRKPLSTWHFISHMIIGVNSCVLSWLHFERHKTVEGVFLATVGFLCVCLTFHYRKHGVPVSLFNRDTPFYFFKAWEWDAPPPGWRKATLNLAFWASLFGFLGCLFILDNPAGGIFILMSGWFCVHLFRLLWRVHKCREHEAAAPEK